MKRILLPFFLIATTALVLIPFRPHVSSRGRTSTKVQQIIFEQMSQKAVINLKDPAQIEAFMTHGLKVTSPHSDLQTIVKIAGHHGPVSNPKIESPGKVSIINPGGIVVGETSNLEATPVRSGELNAHGNTYALAIQKGDGTLRAVELGPRSEAPTIFEYPKDEGKLRFSDE